ncbi:MAG: nuclear transport factor 2 family protein [Solirubrobacteraceae bacterium]
MASPSPNAAERFRRAAEALDADAMTETLAPDVCLASPVIAAPVEGRERVRAVFGVLVELFEDFEYLHALADEGGSTHVLVFRCRVGPEVIEGVDLLELDEHDQIAVFTVFIRPLPGLQALAGEIAARLGARPPKA